MAAFGVLEEKTDRCPRCGTDAAGVLYCPADAPEDGPIVLHDEAPEFLCVAHFRAFLAAGDRRVVQAPSVKWRCLGHRPKSFTPAQLSRAGVKILDQRKLLLGCEWCGMRWSPYLRAGGRLPRGYWKCPRCHQ